MPEVDTFTHTSCCIVFLLLSIVSNVYFFFLIWSFSSFFANMLRFMSVKFVSVRSSSSPPLSLSYLMYVIYYGPVALLTQYLESVCLSVCLSLSHSCVFYSILPLSTVFQLYHGDSPQYSCLSWVSPVLGWGFEVSCRRTLPQKTQRIQGGSSP